MFSLHISKAKPNTRVYVSALYDWVEAAVFSLICVVVVFTFFFRIVGVDGKSMMDTLMTGTRILIWMVGLGTLFAGAIGVSNIMMVTVRERTTEIGIRRAIGARPKDILQQILSESMVLTTAAGMAGISFAVLVLQILESAANEPGIIKTHYQVSFGLAIGTCALLIALGVLAGLAPAYRAMAIKPIEAIRDE